VNLLNLPAIFVIDSFFPNVKGVGSCICGTMLQGKVERGRILYIGPDFNGNFHPLIIKGIHENRVDIEQAVPGQSVCFAIKSAPGRKELDFRKNFFRKGLILADEAAGEKHKKDVIFPKFAIREFVATVEVLHHATTIKPGYQAVVHAGVVKQAVRILDITEHLLRTGDKGKIRCRFMSRPEFM